MSASLCVLYLASAGRVENPGTRLTANQDTAAQELYLAAQQFHLSEELNQEEFNETVREGANQEVPSVTEDTHREDTLNHPIVHHPPGVLTATSTAVTDVPATFHAASVKGHKHGRMRLDPQAVTAFQTLVQKEDAAHTGHRGRALGQFTVTAYALTAVDTGKSPGQPGFGITASGSKASVGRTVAVDPDVIPIGSLVYIDLPGIGWRLAEDVGGAIRGQHIDLLLPSDHAAVQFGVKHGIHVYGMAD